MKESIKFPVHDEFTMALKSQTGIVAVKDFKFNYNTKVDYFIPEGNIIILLVENGSIQKTEGNTVIYTCKENLLSIAMFEKLINYYEQFKTKTL